MNKQQGKVKIFIGPMFSKKTSSLIDEIDKYVIANKMCIMVKFQRDNRYDDNNIVTHSGRTCNKVRILNTIMIADILDKLMQYDVIGIDESQFYPDCAMTVNYLANNNKIVICSGLNADYKGELFPEIGKIIAIAEKVVKLEAVCMLCYRNSSFTMKTGGSDKQIEIGGKEMYSTVCRTCMWNKDSTLKK